MVLKLKVPYNTVENQFENDVKMYGTQTLHPNAYADRLFENDVKMYGTQTVLRRICY